MTRMATFDKVIRKYRNVLIFLKHPTAHPSLPSHPLVAPQQCPRHPPLLLYCDKLWGLTPSCLTISLEPIESEIRKLISFIIFFVLIKQQCAMQWNVSRQHIVHLSLL